MVANCDRRNFLKWAAASPLLAETSAHKPVASPSEALNVFDMMPPAQKNIAPQHWAYLMSGSDDNLTVQANRDGFQLFQIRSRRFMDVATVDTSVEIFGRRYPTPVMIAPCGHQQAFHPEGELVTARAAHAKGAQMILSTASSTNVAAVAKAYEGALWYQLYTTNKWAATQQLIERAEAAGCPVLAVTVDSAVTPNREMQRRGFDRSSAQCLACHKPGPRRHGMFEGMDVTGIQGLAQPVTWDIMDRIRKMTRMKVMVKGIVTAEDAEDCVRHGIDGILVSNHGGRREESLLSTIECLPEIAQAAGGKVAIIIDSGFRRGTDIFKALALGASAICIGRPYLWGLGAFGQPGIERVLDLLQSELVVTMKFAGASSVAKITPAHVRKRSRA